MALLRSTSGFLSLFILVSLTATSQGEESDLCALGDIDQTTGSIFLNVEAASGSSNKLLCSRVIRLTRPGRLHLNVTHFRIVPSDTFEIFDGPNPNARTLTNITAAPSVVVASGNAVFIRFQRKSGSPVAAAKFSARFDAISYPTKCACRQVRNGKMECEDRYQERVCRISCIHGFHDLSLGKDISCDMRGEGEWNVDIHDRVLSCQKVSAPGLRLGFSFNCGSCEQMKLNEIKEMFRRFLRAQVQDFGGKISITCDRQTMRLNITDEVKSGGQAFKKLKETYDKLDFNNILRNLTELNVNVTSLLKDPAFPVCQESGQSFFELLVTEKQNLSDVCSACPLHHFFDRRVSGCVACPKGSTAPAGAASTCVNGSLPATPIQHSCETTCPLGKQFDKTTGFCEWCPVGQYQDSTVANSTCSSCPLGQTTRFGGAMSLSLCIGQCNPGQFYNVTTCEKCPLDSYQEEQNLFTRCKPCGRGRYTAATGSAEENLCLGPCSAGQFFDEQKRTCKECPQHTYQDGVGEHQCKNCSNGEMTLGLGAKNASDCMAPCQAGQRFSMANGTCVKCPVGSYQEQDNHLDTKCTLCGSEKTTARNGTKNSAECIAPCQAGQRFSKFNGTCVECPVGSYQDQSNHLDVKCKLCRSGKTTAGKGANDASDCIAPCQAGERFSKSNGTCVECPVGSYQDQSNHLDAKCKLCESGKTTADEGAKDASECILACAPGKFAEEGKRCRDCARGYFQDKPDQASCNKCPDGKTTREGGQTSDSACGYFCPAGTFLDAKKNCSACPAGTYQDATEHSAEECSRCVSGATSAAGATNATACYINCDVYPCQHGAHCIPREEGFSCQCGKGLHGERCEVIENKDQLLTVEMSLGITSLDWVGQLEDHTSLQYGITKGRIELEIEEIMAGSEQYIAVEVTDLNNGSVVAFVTLFFEQTSDPAPARKLQDAAEQGAVGNLTVNFLTILQHATPSPSASPMVTAATTAAPSVAASASNGKLSWGAYLGIACFTLFVLIIIGSIAMCYRRRRSNTKNLSPIVEMETLLHGNEGPRYARRRADDNPGVQEETGI